MSINLEALEFAVDLFVSAIQNEAEPSFDDCLKQVLELQCEEAEGKTPACLPGQTDTVRCETLFWIGLGEEEECGQPAVAVVDVGTEDEFPVCRDCARKCHPSRLTWLPEVVEVFTPSQVQRDSKTKSHCPCGEELDALGICKALPYTWG